jgi:rSAM/selenodomain-associated transferase 2
MLSIIIPTLNEAAIIEATLGAVAMLRGQVEVLVVDGGSEDGTPEIVRRCGVRLINASRGRGTQMHAGAVIATGEVLWFLHADTQPPKNAIGHILKALADPAVAGGHFAIQFSGPRKAARLLTWVYPRLRWFGLCYGDSGIFVRRTAYERAGGFRPFPIFEDLDLLRRLKRCGRFVHLLHSVKTSSRRFESSSFTLTFAWWTVLQVLYWMGVSPHFLGRLYAPIRSRVQKPARVAHRC